jgi:hypothetical protein
MNGMVHNTAWIMGHFHVTLARPWRSRSWGRPTGCSRGCSDAICTSCHVAGAPSAVLVGRRDDDLQHQLSHRGPARLATPRLQRVARGGPGGCVARADADRRRRRRDALLERGRVRHGRLRHLAGGPANSGAGVRVCRAAGAADDAWPVDRLGLWTIVAILLVAAAHGYPLMQLLAHPRFGLPSFKPF